QVRPVYGAGAQTIDETELVTISDPITMGETGGEKRLPRMPPTPSQQPRADSVHVPAFTVRPIAKESSSQKLRLLAGKNRCRSLRQNRYESGARRILNSRCQRLFIWPKWR